VKRLVLLSILLALAACGRIAPLEPAPGHSLPVKPAMAARQPTAEELLAPRTDAAPSRVDELIRKSAPRRADRFDLPPPDGGAPTLPAATEPAATSSNKTGPEQPK
jgi:predicted small lipoprotein YifL